MNPVPSVKIPFVPPKRPSAEEDARTGQPTGGTIELWHGSLEYSGWRRLAGLLSDEERRRADVFAFERDARRFVVSHAMLRTLLGHAIGIPAGTVKLRTEPGFKPVLEASPCRPIHFSLSRSQDLVLIGFASRPLGVDIACLTQSLDLEALAEQALSQWEQDRLKQICSADRAEALLRCWTQKEAYLKAIGAGLHVPPAEIEVRFRPGGPAGLRSVFGDRRAVAGWFVDIVAPRADCIAAVAIPGRLWRMKTTPFDTLSRLAIE